MCDAYLHGGAGVGVCNRGLCFVLVDCCDLFHLLVYKQGPQRCQSLPTTVSHSSKPSKTRAERTRKKLISICPLLCLLSRICDISSCCALFVSLLPWCDQKSGDGDQASDEESPAATTGGIPPSSFGNNNKNVRRVYRSIIHNGERGSLTLTDRFFLYQPDRSSSSVIKCSWSEVDKIERSPDGAEKPMVQLWSTSGLPTREFFEFGVPQSAILMDLVREAEVRVERQKNLLSNSSNSDDNNPKRKKNVPHQGMDVPMSSKAGP